jgi:hypothetical protein
MFLVPGKNGNDRKMRQKVQHMPYHCKATIKHLFEPVYIDMHTFYFLKSTGPSRPVGSRLLPGAARSRKGTLGEELRAGVAG